MSEMLPLFPLGTVLFPGMLLPLHVFEERYQQMVADLLARPEPRQFGVIAIRKGREVGAGAIDELYDIGCVAVVREATPRDDGRFDLATVGTRRFRLLRTDRTLSYVQGEIDPIPDEDAAQAAGVVKAVQAAFREYLNVLTDRLGAMVRVTDIPDDPTLLSYVVAAAMIIDLPEQQGLLAAPDSVSRLKAERALLARERAMLRATTSRPATDLSREPYSPNLRGVGGARASPSRRPPAGRGTTTKRGIRPQLTDRLQELQLVAERVVRVEPAVPGEPVVPLDLDSALGELGRQLVDIGHDHARVCPARRLRAGFHREIKLQVAIATEATATLLARRGRPLALRRRLDFPHAQQPAVEGADLRLGAGRDT